ncbi:glutamine amidotransferase / cyclase [Desulfacinum hydrothermale DSM 13146]|uniref:Imidazole glycerol phosphate synthase subunit HisH n=1 Tax=Desulfacinum hydrothermale DSM 13146 TaxID=1121390 RepID=A0A1W1XFE5_9BACT|nr:imidazole glycerol phosphate synthase subunit HisF [Desulfacinum hydrothermale]SMC22557.1 glutamine amidotransferase / cyclase [Desulfacinum hydrothermale DSM 13146]
MVTVLDYGAGNVRSVVNAIRSLGRDVRFVERPEDIVQAERLVFPGVGAFGEMMRVLRHRGYVDPLLAYLRSGRPFLGICLGLQALFEGSEEAPGEDGLGFFPGIVRRFRVDRAVPHMGWNGIRARKPSSLLHGLKGDEKLYFVHSYYVDSGDPSVVLTVTDYGVEFVSAVEKGQVAAVQFHPEKSGPAGLKILENFLGGQAAPVLPPVAASQTELARRIIACLDVRANDQGDLVVTKGDQYDVREEGRVRNLGKPVELARRYYEEGADEITFLNITGFRDFPLKDMPMLEVLRRTSEEVFVPLTIGGGIRDYTDKDGTRYDALQVASQYFRSGADKVSIGSDAVAVVEEVLKRGGPTGRSAIETISRVYGSQAVVISIDPRRVYVPSPDAVPHRVIETAFPGPNGERFCWYQCTVKGGREGRDVDAVTLARVCQQLGAGEILLNCIDRDGTNQGFDLELIHAVREAVTIPVIASSGAGCAQHFLDVFTKTRAEAALAAGIFHRRKVGIGEVKAFLKGKVPVRWPLT